MLLHMFNLTVHNKYFCAKLHWINHQTLTTILYFQKVSSKQFKMGMWWEIVPTFGICMVLAAGPVWLQRGLNKAMFGTCTAKNLMYVEDYHLYMRDRSKADAGPMSISRRYYNKNTGVGEGNVYYTHGLEKYD